MVLEGVAIPLQSRVVIFCFFVGRAVGWGWRWGDERQGSKWFLPKAEGGVGKETEGEKNPSSWFPDSFPRVFSSVHFLPSVLRWAHNSPFANTCIENQEDGNTRFRYLPLASPYTTSLSKTESGPPAPERRDRTVRKPSSRSCHHPGWGTAGSFGARPPRREQLLPVISASQGSKCALL